MPSATLRCPLPPIAGATIDSLRQFERDGAIPQYRILVAPPLSLAKTSTSTTSKTSTTTKVTATGSGTGVSLNAATSNASITTPPISFGVPYSTVVGLSKTFALLRISVSSPARVQLYSTASSLAMDSGRDLLTPVQNGPANGIIADFDLELMSEESFLCSPIVLGFNGDSPQSTAIYIAVTNMMQSTSPITVSFFFVSLE